MKKCYSLSQLAEMTGSKLVGDPNYIIEGIENLDAAGPRHAAFLENPRYEKQMVLSKAGVIFIHPSISPIEGRFFLLNEAPSLAFQQVIELFIQSPQTGFLGIHPTAVIHEEASIGEGVTIGPKAVIDRAVSIGDGTFIGAGVYVGAETTIGSACHLHANVIIREGCSVGNRVIIQPGAVIGSCGFGYFTDKKGTHLPLKQLGSVVIEDDVEIGANTTIDRARFKTTRIGRGTKIDNLVQIAHQVELGESNLIVSQVGIAGSTKTGHHVVMGGQAGIIGHITITDGVILAARSAVSKSIEKSGIYSGIPAAPIKEFNAQFVQLRSVGKLVERLKALEAKVKSLETLSENSKEK